MQNRAYPDVPYVGVYKVLNQPAIVLRDLDLIKDVMTTSFSHFCNNDFVVNPELDPLISNNPFAAVDDNWKTARMNMAPLFTTMKVGTLLRKLAFTCVWCSFTHFEFRSKCCFPSSETLANSSLSSFRKIGKMSMHPRFVLFRVIINYIYRVEHIYKKIPTNKFYIYNFNRY